MRIVIQQGGKFIDGDGMGKSDPFGSFVILTPDRAKAHDFKTQDEAQKWLVRKGIVGRIVEIEDAAERESSGP